jgi:hypothetical protein
MKHMLTITIFLSLLGCGASLTDATKQTLTIEMLGAHKSKTGADGTSNPQWQVYTLTGVSFLSADATETSTLSEDGLENEFKIIDRAQIIFKKDIKDLVDKEFSAVTVNFDEEVTGGSAASDSMSFVMTNPDLVLTKEFAVTSGRSLTLTISVNWKNSVEGEEMSEPGYTLTLD